MRTLAAAFVCMFLLAAGNRTPAPGGARDARSLLEAAQQAMTAERFDEAMALYGQAGELLPDAAEIPFNMGVAAYRAGQLERASELFDRARTLSADPALQARSAYNLGTTAARRALDSKMGDPAAAQAQMADATESLKTALDRFRDAIAMNPEDEDARANGEVAWRWLKQLEALQDRMQQQGDRQQEGDEEQQEQQQDQQQQEQQGQDESQQQQQSEQQQDQQQQQQQGRDEQQEQEQPQPQGGDEQQEQPEDEEPQPTAGEEEADERDPSRTSDEQPMSREEAERLLQSVRDKEAQRREQLARQEAARHRPVDKDW